MKGMNEILYFDGRGQIRKVYYFENTRERIYSNSNSFWQLIGTVKSNNRTGVVPGPPRHFSRSLQDLTLS